jgi:hypothetical protein
MSFDGTLLKCLDKTCKKVLQEAHEGICVTHVSGHMTVGQKTKVGYFCMTMEMDCIEYDRKFHKY